MSKSDTESEHAKECYAYFGLAVYYSQVLEHQLVNMIILLKRSQGLLPTESDFDVLYIQRSKRTLGNLISEIKELFQLQEDEKNELEEVLRQRNFIVHDYFKEKIALTLTESGRNELVNELQRFVERVRNIDSRLEVYSDRMRKSVGLTDEMLENELKIIRNEVGLDEREDSSID
ncbi:hypothetical protein QP794_25670 [Paenibacillus sp. UMB7766-LJ446]|uniref:hypothetical protein n=1 Tax=Paenibacillus sp. UMB7766-LJ446 TaxID=3046313 RepID=UPI00255117BA|nr:hypothetical protein [Paenibacillus sp. UMB7766-LJ446]MDK8193484.1 hypothetical protein [Paenibacillus sp. UMB7766-LJ446]